MMYNESQRSSEWQLNLLLGLRADRPIHIIKLKKIQKFIKGVRGIDVIAYVTACYSN